MLMMESLETMKSGETKIKALFLDIIIIYILGIFPYGLICFHTVTNTVYKFKFI